MGKFGIENGQRGHPVVEFEGRNRVPLITLQELVLCLIVIILFASGCNQLSVFFNNPVNNPVECYVNTILGQKLF